MKHLDSLNEKQKEAVLATEGPLLILAGAGAGKTKTITHRILHLIKNGTSPRSVLAITFTNKAAKEMRERVMHLIKSDPELNLPIEFQEAPFVSTFHALGVHVIKENARLLGLTRHFTIVDKNDSQKLIKEALAKAELDPKQFEPNKVQNVISREKGNLVTAASYEAKAGSSYVPRMISRVWREYETLLAREKALDFDDLLLKTALLLRDNETVRSHYQNVWKYIHIDEYQDTNRVQYMISKMLAEKDRNICVVGDADQNIYSWRGADIKNILDFEKDYPEAKVVLLEENYRSTQTILTVANRIIAKNKMRKEKNLFTKNTDGEKIGLLEAYDEADEARFVATKSKQLIEEGTDPKQIAVLYRANFQGRVLEEAFLHADVPYQVLGTRFFERKEVKDVVSYLRAALNPDSLSDLKRIINVPPRGIGKVTLAKLFSGLEKELSPAMQSRIQNFRALLERIRETAQTEKLSQTIKFIMREGGIEEELKQGTTDDQERLENVRELVTFATKYDSAASNEEAIDRFLSDVALASDQDELMHERSGVKLMTIHASKGLEFDYVFITGLEQDLFPHKRMSESTVAESQAEEERRLFYVAVTRARKKVYLSYASVRTIFGSRQVNVPSEFVFDIDDEFVEKEERFEGGGKIIYLD